MIREKPDLSIEEARELVKGQYNIIADYKLLDGERDQNFLLSINEKPEYILKIINPLEDKDFILAQNDVLNHLEDMIDFCPVLVSDSYGDALPELENRSGNKYLCRLVKYIEGKAYGELKDAGLDTISDIGRKLGRMDKALQNYYNGGFNRYFKWDLDKFEDTVYGNVSAIGDKYLRTFIEKTINDYESLVKPYLKELRKSVIHNDINDYNIIIDTKSKAYKEEPSVAGFIDFGDMVYSYTIANPATAMAYILLNRADSLRAAAEMLAAYHKSFGINDNEFGLVFTMARMRLALSISIAESQLKERPGDDYLAISQAPIKKAIPLIESIDPLFAETVFRSFCGVRTSEKTDGLIKEIFSSARDSFPVIGHRLNEENSLVIDLGITSSLVEGEAELNSAESLGERISRLTVEKGKDYAIGRYMEARLLYSSPVFQSEGFTSTADRTIHLGIDIFAPADAEVYAPLDGEVYDFTYNPGELDYGHLIILRHNAGKDGSFYTLYGHLGKRSFVELEKGKKIRKGEVFAWLGTADENGGWSPHLHFQILTDLLGYGTDFPGVCKAWEKDAFRLLSPDPNIFLNIPEGLFPGKDPEIEETCRLRKEYFADNLSLSYRSPLKIVRAYNQYLFDESGHKYLDAYNNVPHIGHSNPEIAETVYHQMKLLNTNTRYLSDRLNEYAELLLSTFSKPLEVCFFVNSASEANELALRLAFTYTRKKDVIVLEGAYHGHTNALIDISPYKHSGPGGKGAPEWVHTAAVPDGYRGMYKYQEADAGRKYAMHVAEIIEDLEKERRAPAAFIAETCPSVGGQIIPPPHYLEEVYKYIRKAEGLCIADEVQTGYGRMGRSFYAYEDQDVIPDIVVLGKPIGNGHPIAAVVTTRDIADAFNTGMEFFSTFGGNTVSAVVGKKVLEIILRENYMEHARITGDYMLDRLNQLKERFPIIGDVRGSGFFLGVELVRDHNSLEPAGDEAAYIKEKLKERKILIGTDGPCNNVLKIRPPMPFNKDDADILVSRLVTILENNPFV